MLLGVTNDLLAQQTNLITLRLTNATTMEDATLSDHLFSANFTFVSSLDVYTPLSSFATVSTYLLSLCLKTVYACLHKLALWSHTPTHSYCS